MVMPFLTFNTILGIDFLVEVYLLILPLFTFNTILSIDFFVEAQAQIYLHGFAI